jgi:hypothetical protein
MAVPASFKDIAADAAVRDYFGDVALAPVMYTL